MKQYKPIKLSKLLEILNTCDINSNVTFILNDKEIALDNIGGYKLTADIEIHLTTVKQYEKNKI